MSREELLRVKGIKKFFAATQALNDVEMEICRGEVHALMGENGAGKSTLIKIITGAYVKDDGQIFFNGKEVQIYSRADAQRLGISCIYQELSVIPTLTVAQNILIGREPKIGKTPLVSKKRMNQEVQNLIDLYGFPLKAADILETLPIAQRQMVEILKALSAKASLIIMDEPTASLSGKESETLFSIIKNLREKDISVLYISHRLDEVYMLADRLTVLRDGKKVALLTKEEIVPEKVIHLMIGKTLEDNTNQGVMVPSSDETLLEVRNLSRPGFFGNISFTAKKGEIVGFGGLVGSGRTEVMRCIFGADSYASGEIFLEGKPFIPVAPRKSIDAGIALVPEDRRGQGFIPLLSIKRNTALPNYDLINRKFGAISSKKELEMSYRAIKDLDIRPEDPEMKVALMSGGNQQKVVLGKWLRRDLKVLIVDEPTAGIDVGAKEEIYNLLKQLAAAGVLILLVSSDLQELVRLSTRILVMRKGTITAEFNQGTVTQNDVLSAASGL
ncbi:MAG: sugar ABC transporter ATP-binding protein [Treponema sp.]|jgi:ribose transport system ATP-binding protein|nr:sugar ABC transporter ATP-binding protein [Treponema sp.]